MTTKLFDKQQKDKRTKNATFKIERGISFLSLNFVTAAVDLPDLCRVLDQPNRRCQIGFQSLCYWILVAELDSDETTAQ